MAEIKENSVKDFLFKEASKKREHRKKAIVHEFLFVEAETEELELELEKEAMATQSGGSTLKNSGWNTDWTFIDPSRSIGRVKNQVSRVAQQYFASLGQGTEEASFAPSPISFLFRYIRTILPENNEEASAKAKNAIDILDAALPGFRQFQEDIQTANIPLCPYFITSNHNKNNGRVTPNELNEFIMAETNKPLQMPDNFSNQSHYKEHNQRIKTIGHIDVSDYPNKPRVFPMSDLDSISTPSMLVQAIEDKKKNKYLLNENGLEQTIRNLLDQRLQANDIDRHNPEHFPQFKIYARHYMNLLKNIVDWWDGNPVVLPAFALRIIMRNLAYAGGGVPEVPRDQFRIPEMSSLYASNGWDSSPNDPNRKMLTLPPLRQLPRGEVVYDRGNGNMGYDHLVLNWKQGLAPLFQTWGQHCDDWLKKLQSGQGMENMQQQSPEVVAAWQNIISQQSGNRTGAETLLVLLL